MATRFTYFGFEYEVLEDKKNEVALIDARNAQGRTFIPKEVEYNGQKYAVTQITGKMVGFWWYHDFNDKRRKIKEELGYTYRGAFESINHDHSSHNNLSLVTWYSNENQMEIIIPNTVKVIGKHAFGKCTGLTAITIPDSVTSIEDYAFYRCEGLTTITIPNSVKSIGDSAFSECKGLTSITIPNSVTSIGGWAFKNCGSLISVVIPNSVTSIGEGAFAYCYALAKVTLPNSISSIEKKTFESCTSLTNATIPASVKTIAEKAFARYDSYSHEEMQLENVRIENDEGEVIIHPDAFEPNVKIEYVGKPKNKPAKEVKETKKQEAEQVSGVTIDLEKLIAAALVDGVVTDKERAILCKKVKETGGDVDEFEMLLDARIYEAQQKAQPAALKAEMNKGESKPTPKPEQKKEEVKPVSAEQVVTSSAGGKTATYGVWKVCIYDDGKAEVYKNGELCPKSSPALREIAAEIGLEVNPEWRTSQLSRNVLKAMQ